MVRNKEPLLLLLLTVIHRMTFHFLSSPALLQAVPAVSDAGAAQVDAGALRTVRAVGRVGAGRGLPRAAAAAAGPRPGRAGRAGRRAAGHQEGWDAAR